MAESSATEVRQVRVSYGPEGRGLTLAPAIEGPVPSEVESTTAPDPVNGVLRIGDGCVTLELPMPDGATSVLAWDPAEVGLADVGLAIAG